MRRYGAGRFGRRSRSRPVRRLRCGGFRRRKRLFVRPFGRRSRSRSVRRVAALSLRSVRRVAALPLTLGSPRCGAPAHARLSALGGGAPARARADFTS